MLGFTISEGLLKVLATLINSPLKGFGNKVFFS